MCSWLQMKPPKRRLNLHFHETHLKQRNLETRLRRRSCSSSSAQNLQPVSCISCEHIISASTPESLTLFFSAAAEEHPMNHQGSAECRRREEGGSPKRRRANGGTTASGWRILSDVDMLNKSKPNHSSPDGAPWWQLAVSKVQCGHEEVLRGVAVRVSSVINPNRQQVPPPTHTQFVVCLL